MEKSRNKELRDLFQAGVGCHHAGMLRADRGLTERSFEDGAIKVNFVAKYSKQFRRFDRDPRKTCVLFPRLVPDVSFSREAWCVCIRQVLSDFGDRPPLVFPRARQQGYCGGMWCKLNGR